MNFFFLLIATLLFVSCDSTAQKPVSTLPQPQEFSDYWYAGEAEVTSYNLQQARYGDNYPGQAVLIFVTEDFSKDKQVKLDNPNKAGNDATKVLKLNVTKKFTTGIYPYSMMSSVFSPIYLDEGPLKVTTSAQEWCGHTFTQLNKNKKGYNLQAFSYFETEGDLKDQLPYAILEDGLWNQIRLNPKALPVGEINLIPGTLTQRLTHMPLAVVKATASISVANFEGWENLKAYRIFYPKEERELIIYFNPEFPYEIKGWEESYGSGVTKAVENKRIKVDYWNKNGVNDGEWRKKLGL